jgi:hypothetical protein
MHHSTHRLPARSARIKDARPIGQQDARHLAHWSPISLIGSFVPSSAYGAARSLKQILKSSENLVDHVIRGSFDPLSAARTDVKYARLIT